MGLFSGLLGDKDNDRLSEIIKQGAVLVDVRDAAEFAKGSVNGAINIPVDELPSKLAKIRGRKYIVVFCKTGNRSAHAKTILALLGFDKVLNGGTWKNVQNVLLNET